MELEYRDDRRRGKIIVVVGVILALVAGGAAYYLLNQAQTQAGNSALPRVPAVVAVAVIPARQPIKADGRRRPPGPPRRLERERRRRRREPGHRPGARRDDPPEPARDDEHAELVDRGRPRSRSSDPRNRSRPTPSRSAPSRSPSPTISRSVACSARPVGRRARDGHRRAARDPLRDRPVRDRPGHQGHLSGHGHPRPPGLVLHHASDPAGGGGDPPHAGDRCASRSAWPSARTSTSAPSTPRAWARR